MNSPVLRQVKVNTATRWALLLLGSVLLALTAIASSDLIHLTTAATQRRASRLLGEHVLLSLAMGVVSGVVYVLVERLLIRRSAPSWRNFICQPFSRRRPWPTDKAALPMLLFTTLCCVVAPAAIAALGFSLPAFAGAKLVAMGIRDTEFSRLTSELAQIDIAPPSEVPPNPSLQRTPPG